MKKTIFTNSLPLGVANAMRPLAFLGSCLAFLFLMGVQQAGAQTVDDVGEAVSAHVYNLFKAEADALEYEMKESPAGVNTEYNLGIARYYMQAVNSWLEGNSQWTDEMISNIGYVNLSNDPGTANVSIQDIQMQENLLLSPISHDMTTYTQLVNAVNLEDQDDQDLLDIFNFLRTLKNQ